MKTLEELYNGIGIDAKIKSIQNSIEKAQPGDLFVCFQPRDIQKAIDKGVKAIVVDSDIQMSTIPIIKVPDAKTEYNYLCQKFYDYPDCKLKTMILCGMDGKTSIGKIIQQLLGTDACGFIGTNTYSCIGFSSPNLTTPDCNALYSYIHSFVEYNCKYAILEASDTAIFDNQFQAIVADTCIYTGSFNSCYDQNQISTYIKECSKLFSKTKRFCIFNGDDQFFPYLKENCDNKVYTYGQNSNATLRIVECKFSSSKTIVKFQYQNEEFQVTTKLLSIMNVYNLAASLLCCLLWGYSLDELIKKCNDIKIDGRLEMLNTETSYSLMIDASKSQKSLSLLIQFIKSLDFSKIVLVVDFDSQSLINASFLEDCYVIFISKNNMAASRNSSIHLKYEFAPTRREGIEKGVNLLGEKDILLIVGQGDNFYSDSSNQSLKFTDKEVAYQALVNRKIKEER